MQTRTTILLDQPSRRAAKQLAAHLDVSPSEAIRRALAHYRNHVIGSPEADRRRRLAALDRSLVAFRGMDPAAELRRMKREDDEW